LGKDAFSIYVRNLGRQAPLAPNLPNRTGKLALFRRFLCAARPLWRCRHKTSAAASKRASLLAA
jgi:hypothetical protein